MYNNNNAPLPTRLCNILVKIENTLLVSLLVGMIIVAFLQVLFRYLFLMSAPWTEELGKFLLAWLIFIGAAWAVYSEDHIKVDVLGLIITNKKILTLLDILTTCIMTAFICFFTYASIIYIPQVISSNATTISLGIPLWIPQTVIVLSSMLMLVHILELLIRKIFINGQRGS